ncbi:Ribosomal lysine N-methyltransferase 5 [Spathaspora sp. JA1]|nr:Ribosomal lysine N-methyltransferase 5 [Spathaspora sp. JA1]
MWGLDGISTWWLMDLEDLVSRFDEIERNYIDDHIFELYCEGTPPANLGYVDRSSNIIDISLPQSEIDLKIKQSLTELSSTKKTSSTTGFLCWKSSVLLCDWLLTSDNVLMKLFSKSSNVIELGAGVAGICTSILAKKVHRYTATDQKHILKLLKENIESNITTSYVSTTLNNSAPVKRDITLPIVNVIEFDWEEIEQGMFNYQDVTGNSHPDIILACDTIYNEYLIPHFINTVKRLLKPDCSLAIVALQLRDSITIESFVRYVIITAGLRMYMIPAHLLSEELKSGYVIYILTL